MPICTRDKEGSIRIVQLLEIEPAIDNMNTYKSALKLFDPLFPEFREKGYI